MQPQNQPAQWQCGTEPTFEAILTARLHAALFSRGCKVWLEGTEGNPSVRNLVDPEQLRIGTRIPAVEILQNQAQKIVDQYFDGLSVRVIPARGKLAFLLDGQNPAQQLQAKLDTDGPGQLAHTSSGAHLVVPPPATWAGWIEAANSNAGIAPAGRK